jgi:hypothetical protein
VTGNIGGVNGASVHLHLGAEGRPPMACGAGQGASNGWESWRWEKTQDGLRRAKRPGTRPASEKFQGELELGCQGHLGRNQEKENMDRRNDFWILFKPFELKSKVFK